MSDILQSALALAKRGFRVFPLIQGGKLPAVKRFPVVATTDVAVIKQWWAENPNYNVGVSTTGFVVVDIDTKKGQHALPNFYAMGGEFNTLTVRTATGGYHCYYHGPDSKLAVDITESVDIRSHNGYVVGPGSVVPAGTYSITVDVPMVHIPVAFEMALEPPNSIRDRQDVGELDEPFNIANAAVWLGTATPAIEGQGGNTSAYKVAAKLVRDFALSQETAYQQLISNWNERCIPPWSPGELWAIVQHASDYGVGPLGAASPKATFGEVNVPEQPNISQAPKPYTSIGAHLGNAVPIKNQPPRPWRVDKLAMAGDVTLLGGMGAMGKSMFQLVCAAHFAVGKDFGPYKLKVAGMPMRSIVYNAEDDVLEQSRRLSAVCQQFNFDYNIVIQGILLLDDAQGPLVLATSLANQPVICQPAVDFITSLASENLIDLIWLDPLVNIHQCNENDNVHMRFVMGLLRAIARATNTSVIASHHTGKSSGTKDKGDADVFRGGGSLVNSARIAVIMSSITKGDAEMFGIRTAAMSNYVRMDVGKANMFKKDGKALAWLEWGTVRHINGDLIGVPFPVDMRSRKSDQVVEIATCVRDFMRSQGQGSINRKTAIDTIKSSDLIQNTLTESALGKIIDAMFEEPVTVGDDTLVKIVTDNGKALIKLT